MSKENSPRSIDAGQIPEQDPRRETREALDGHIKKYGDVLFELDKVCTAFRVASDGKITKPTIPVGFSSEQNDRFAPVRKFVEETLKERDALVAQLRQEDGVLDAHHAFGAVIVIFDSSGVVPNSVRDMEMEEGTRAIAQALADEDKLGLIAVDMNGALRQDGVSPTISLVHELHHHVRTLTDIALGLDDKMPMQTATLGGQHQWFVDERKDKTFRSPWERLKEDCKFYETLLERDLPQRDSLLAQSAREIREQREYLDELHSSYLQKKPGWFSASTQLYAGGRKGTHEELVGSRPLEAGAGRNLLCYLQGMYCADQMHAMLKQMEEGKRTRLVAEKPWVEEFFVDFPPTFIRFGAYLGVARTLIQAERFAALMWQELIKNDNFSWTVKKFLVNFETAKSATGIAADGRSMMPFLLNEQPEPGSTPV